MGGLFEDRAIADIALADIAARSGVTAETVLRRFGDKDAVFAAMFDKLATMLSGGAAGAHSTRSTRSSLTC
jgi:AcrR family transcriptional regulator